MPKFFTTNTLKDVGVFWIIFSIVLAIFDQVSKVLVLDVLELGQSISVMPSLNFSLAFNPGIAFSMLNQDTFLVKALLLCIVIAISTFICIWLIRTPKEQLWLRCSLSLILGGAIGNIWDRITRGYVVDFIDFYISDWHWHTFNLADAFICVGALMIIKSLLLDKTDIEE